MSREIELSKEIICAFLNKNISKENIIALYNIKSGDINELYGHIDALASIFTKAKEQLEKEGVVQNKYESNN